MIAGEIEQGPGSDTEDTEVSLEPPTVDDGRRANANTLRCDDDERAGTPLEARIPDVPGEEEEKEEEEEEEGEGEVNSGGESADSRTIARFARSHAANREAHGRGAPVPAAAQQAWAARQAWESEKGQSRRLLSRLKSQSKVAEDSWRRR